MLSDHTVSPPPARLALTVVRTFHYIINGFLQASFIQINPSLDVPPEDPFLLLITCHKSEVQSWPGKMPAGITDG